MNNVRRLLIVIPFILVIIFVSAISCSVNNSQETSTQDHTVYPDADGDSYTLKEAVKGASHILTARFVKEENWNRLYVFEPLTYFRNIEDSINEYIYVTMDSFSEAPSFYEGETVLLILNKGTFVLSEHYEFYGQRGPCYCQSKDDTWNKHLDQVKELVETLEPPGKESMTCTEFIISDDIQEIIDFSTNIFTVHIDSDHGKSPINPCSLYGCTIEAVIKGGMELSNANILLAFPNDSVEIGHEYIVLLADSGDSEVYSLIAKNKSFFDVDQLNDYPEIKALKEQAVPFSGGHKNKNEFELLKEEFEAQEKFDYEYFDAEDSDMSFFFNGILYNATGSGADYSRFCDVLDPFGRITRMTEDNQYFIGNNVKLTVHEDRLIIEYGDGGAPIILYRRGRLPKVYE